MITEQKHTPEPPLPGRWHHGNGNLVCGTIRIAVEDFDTHPSEKVKTEVFDWICHVLNEATKDHTLAAKVKDLEVQIGDLQECEKCGERLPEQSFSVGAVMDGWGDDPCCDACYYKHELSVVSAQRDELLTMMSRFSKYPSKTLDELSAESMRKISTELVAKIEAEKTTKA